MKKNDRPFTPSRSKQESDDSKKPSDMSRAQVETPSANDLGHGTDRPEFDLGGSTGDTFAGTGLGLGEDAFDTRADWNLPGRRLDNHLTKTWWNRPEADDTTASIKRPASTQTLSLPEKKKTR